jgi:beta-lactamase class A
MKNIRYQVGLVFLFLTILCASVLLVRIINVDPTALVVPISETLASVNIPFVHTNQPKNNSLDQAILTTLNESKKDYGVVVHNLKNNESYVLNVHQVFQSGSLYKLWVMATAYDQIKNGLLHETDILQQEIPILNEKFKIATEDAELTEGDITLSVADALFQMITVSDNYAALLLSEKVRLSNVATFLNSHGFTESKVGTDGSIPTTTASDMAKFFTLLYQRTLINKEYDGKMLDLLKGQQLNNKIPKNLPDDITIAHKTGELGLFTHDAGIVFTPENNYIIAVLSETDDPLTAEQNIADISEAVYRYFTE